MSPLVVRNHVLVGVSGDFDNLTGFLKSIDPETGKTQWRWDSTPARGHAQRHHRRHDLDDRHLRSRAQPDLLGDRQSDPRAHRQDAAGRRPVHVQHRGAQPRYRQTGLGLPTLAARHARLGRGRGPGAGGRGLRRQAAQDADAGFAQRLLLRPGPHQRPEPADHQLRPGELEHRRGQEGPAGTQSRQGAGAAMAGSSRPTRAA